MYPLNEKKKSKEDMTARRYGGGQGMKTTMQTSQADHSAHWTPQLYLKGFVVETIWAKSYILQTKEKVFRLCKNTLEFWIVYLPQTDIGKEATVATAWEHAPSSIPPLPVTGLVYSDSSEGKGSFMLCS